MIDKGTQLYLQILSDLHKYWMPHEGQIRAGKPLMQGSVDTLFVQCGRKWGKTDFAAYLLWRHALLNPGSTCYYVTPELTHGREIIWNNQRLQGFGRERTKQGLPLPGGEDVLKKYIKGKPVSNESRIKLKNGSQIKIVGSENWAAANGLTPDFVVYDEFKIFHPTFHNEMNPNRIVRKAPLVIIGTPPKQGDRNLEQYDTYAGECLDDSFTTMKHIEGSSYDNPHIPKEYIDAEIAKLEKRGEWDVAQREYYGRRVTGGPGAIFPMLSKERHVRSHTDMSVELRKDRKKLEWFCVTDPGSTTCFAALIGCINPYTKKLYILDEVYEKEQINTSTGVIYPKLDNLMMMYNPNSDIVEDWVKVYDEAAAWFATECMAQFDVYFTPTQKHLNKKEHGLSLAKDILLHDLVVISDRCQNLFKEMSNYAKDANGNIPKRNDHLIDCLRYLLSAANYSMVEVMEIIKQRNDDSRRAYSLREDYNTHQRENDWTSTFTKDWDLNDD